MNLACSRMTLLVLALAALVSACTEVRSGQLPGDSERSASRALVEQITSLASQPASAERLLQATSIQPVFTLLSPPVAPSAGSKTRLHHDGDLDDCTIASRNATTFTDCALAGHMIDGIWSSQRPASVRQRVYTELGDIFALGPGHYGSLALTASVSRRPLQRPAQSSSRRWSATAGPAVTLTGSVELGITWTADGTDYFLDATLRAENLTIPSHANYEHQCALGGTITITGRFSDSSSSKPGDTALGPVTLSFGPTCQDLQLTR